MSKKIERWYYVNFEFIDSDDKLWQLNRIKLWKLDQTDSLLHYLLAAELFNIIISLWNLKFWRFSRYKYNGESWIFRFKFYVTKQEFNNIKDFINNNKTIKLLCSESESCLKLKYYFGWDCSKNKIGADRDVDWPYTVSQAWPYFINGVSRMWLEMILELKKKYLRENYLEENMIKDISDLFPMYDEIRKEMNSLWQDWGYHFAFHHTNAVFGYNFTKINLLPYDLYFEKSRKKREYVHQWVSRFNRMASYIKKRLFIDKILRKLGIKQLRYKGYINI